MEMEEVGRPWIAFQWIGWEVYEEEGIVVEWVSRSCCVSSSIRFCMCMSVELESGVGELATKGFDAV